MRMLWADSACIAVAGAGAAFSVAHYLAKYRSITAPVPVHFNVFGVPDRRWAPWSFVVYPATCLALTAAMVGAVELPYMRAVMPRDSVERLSASAALLCGEVILVGCQYYAAKISEGKADKLSPGLMWLVYGLIAASAVAALVPKRPASASSAPSPAPSPAPRV